MRYDVCVIGGGPAGYAAAMRALDLKKRVILIEKNKVGGTGLYNGALSSKTFWELSKDILSTRKRLQHYSPDQHIRVEFKEILRQVREGISQRRFHLEGQLETLQNRKDSLLRYTKGAGKMITPNLVEITLTDGSIEMIETENIILATGSSPRKLASIPIDEKIIVTSEGVESFDHFPRSIVILGAGVIGCEWATIFSNFGYTKVNIIDKADKILPFEDDDIIDTVEANMQRQGISVHKNSSLVKMDIVDGEVEYVLEYTDGRREIHRVEKALVSIGRVPNSKNIGVENVGLEVLPNGQIANVDGKTAIPNIYVVGDLSTDVALVNVAELEGRHVVEKMYGLTEAPLIYNNVSTIMFVQPEVAGVGMNEKRALKEKISYKCVKIRYDMIPRAIAMRNNNGFFKILVTNDDEMKILGMRAVGVHASSAIQAVALLISMNKGVEELADMIHPHPSIIEGIQECIRMLLGKSVLKPEVFKGMLQCKSCDENGCVNEIVYLR
jgi:dihydrolipoamide dehydrogenase